MSSRLIALMLLLIAHPAMAQTETTAQAVEQEVTEAVDTAQAATENAEQEATAAVEEATEQAEAAMEETEAAAEEMTEQAEAAMEETEAAAEEMTEQAEAAMEETEAAAEEMTEQAEAAMEETEAAAEEMTEQADAAMEETEAAAEETTETAMAADSNDIEAKLAACAACHGADGNSVIPQNPKLAGQVHGFIANQLAKFKSGERDNAIMAAQVANLSEEDMMAIDAFYEEQQPQLGAISEDMQELARQGEKIYRGGEPSMSISACMSCHGPSGDGIPTRFPRVAGQHIEYLEQQLLAYKSGSRVSEEMNPIAFRLSEQQIKALAAYMHALK